MTLSKAIQRLCDILINQYDNVMRLFQSEEEEQLIMEITGHRSIDGNSICAYKQTSKEQHKFISYAATNGRSHLHDASPTWPPPFVKQLHRSCF